MKEKICVIFGAGTHDGAPLPAKYDLLIAADGGLDTLAALGYAPDLIIGDLDSVKTPPAEEISLIRLSAHKDITDTDAAVQEGLSRGCNCFFLYGMLGGRPDHSFANLTLLARLAQQGIPATLYGAGYAARAVHNGVLNFDGDCRGYLSVFSFSDRSEGVCLRGLAYEMENGTFTNTFGLGVSNEFTGKTASVSVESGTLLVMWQRG